MAKTAGATQPAKPTREEKKLARTAKRQRRRETWKSMGQAFSLTRKQDPKFLPYLILFSVLAAAALYLLVFWLTDSPYFPIPFALFGFLIVGMLVFSRRAQAAMYSQAEGQPGAAGYLMQQQLKGDWRLTQAVAGTTHLDVVHRLVGRPGIVFVGENPSRALHKFSEIYDRIGFAAAGKYNEYENLRIGGVRYADLRGYTYDRDDVTARGLANVYAQTLGTIFSSAGEKPYEVELVVAEVGAEPSGDQIYRLPHDGSIVDEHGSVAVGGNAEQISSFLDQRHRDGMSLAEALKLAVQALSRDTNGTEREIPAERLEVAVLDRTRPQQRKFKRIVGRQLSRLLEADDAAVTKTDDPSDEQPEE